MEKICIVKRRKTTAEASLEPVVEIHAASLVATPISDQEIAEIEQMPEVSLPGPMIASPESFNIHDGDHLIFKEVAGEGPEGLGRGGGVRYEGEDSKEWHTGYGGGLLMQLLGTPMALGAPIANGTEGTLFYFAGGYSF